MRLALILAAFLSFAQPAGATCEAFIAEVVENFKEGFDERLFLVPLEEVVAAGNTPAESLLWRYHGPWERDISRIFEEVIF